MARTKRPRELRPRRGGRAPERTRRAEKARRAEKSAPERGASSPRSRPATQATPTVVEIVATLHAHRQRATYAAVGGLRGAPAVRARAWFAGREGPENSFVVSRLSGEPIGYPPDLVHPELRRRNAVLESADALRAWLAAHPIPRR